MRIGPVATGTADAAAASIASGAQNVPNGATVVAFSKWEGVGVALAASNKFTDNASNTYTVIGELADGTGEPTIAMAVAQNVVGNAALVTTTNFASAGAVFRRTFQMIFTERGAAGVDTWVTGTGTGLAFSTAAKAVIGNRMVIAGVGGFTTMTGQAAGGSPAFQFLANLSDSFLIVLPYESNGVRNVLPAASAGTGSAKWLMAAFSLLDVAGRNNLSLPIQHAVGGREDGKWDTAKSVDYWW
jgi:hypothetical protein